MVNQNELTNQENEPTKPSTNQLATYEERKKAFKLKIRQKRIEKGLPVPPTEEELNSGNIVEEGATLLYQFLGHGSRITLHPGNIVKKSGRGVVLQEAAALRVAYDAGLPVPEPYGTEVTPDGRNQIRMGYIDGKRLDDIWGDLTEDEKRSYALQLREILEKMRAIPPPSDGLIGTCDGKEVRNPTPLETYTGPRAFSQGDNKGHGTAFGDAKEHRVVLTHRDLAPRNIIVRDGAIVGLIDWEDGGWYPEYWEYVKFFQRKGSTDRDFVRFSEDIFPCEYPDELVDSIALSKYQ